METAAPVSTSILRTLPLISITVIGCTALDESFILNNGNSESVSLSFSSWPVSTQLVAPLCWCDFFLAAPVQLGLDRFIFRTEFVNVTVRRHGSKFLVATVMIRQCEEDP